MWAGPGHCVLCPKTQLLSALELLDGLVFQLGVPEDKVVLEGDEGLEGGLGGKNAGTSTEAVLAALRNVHKLHLGP